MGLHLENDDLIKQVVRHVKDNISNFSKPAGDIPPTGAKVPARVTRPPPTKTVQHHPLADNLPSDLMKTVWTNFLLLP